MARILFRTAFLLCVAAGISGCAAPDDAIQGRVEESQDSEAYGTYRNALARSNLEREKAGQAPVPIMEREEWAVGHAAQREAAGEQ